MDVTDLLHQISGWLGTGAAAVAGEVYRRFRSAEKSAKDALQAATEAKALVAEVKKSFVEAKKTIDDNKVVFDQTRQGLKLELDAFKADTIKKLNELEERELRLMRGSRPDLMSVEEMQRQIDQLRGKLDEIRGEMRREQDHRHSIERTINETAREESKWKSDLNRLLGSIEAQIEILMEASRRES